MNDTTEWLLRAATMGAGATLVMDAWALLLRRFGIPSLNLALLGRWLGHLPRQWTHAPIAAARPIRGERILGWSAHYAIGVTFAALLLAIGGLGWARTPSLGLALAVGVGTAVAPIFVLQPALGVRGTSARLKSVVTHAVFGLGLYAAASATAALFPGAWS